MVQQEPVIVFNNLVDPNQVAHLSDLRNYTAVTTTYAVLSTDRTVEATSGTFTITMPTAIGLQGYIFNIKNSGTGTITVATTSSQTIDGDTTVTLEQYEGITIQSNNSNWIIL